jgi:peptidoglycan-associated lipoprotein
MKTITLTTLLAALVATGLVACGDKNKKPAGAAVDTAGDTSRQPESGTATDRSSGEQDLAAVDPSLTPVIYFEFDQSTLSDEAKAELEKNAEWLKADPARTLTIEGHTDEVGTTEYNVALGERRAQAAHEYIVRLGIDASRVQILSFGEERPASTEDSANRRAMFIATKQK